MTSASEGDGCASKDRDDGGCGMLAKAKEVEEVALRDAGKSLRKFGYGGETTDCANELLVQFLFHQSER